MTHSSISTQIQTHNYITQENRLFDVPLTKAELLMLHFFAEESQELNIPNRYPEIKKVLLNYNTPLPSSAAVERLFSFATMISAKEP